MANTENSDDVFSAKWFRGLVIAALLSGAGGGISSLNKDTSDRFKRADFRREIARRDARIETLERTQAAHLQHSARYTELIRHHTIEIARLERELDKHEDKH